MRLFKLQNSFMVIQFKLLIGYSIFLQLSSNPLSNAALTIDGKSAILDKGLLYISCYGLIGTSLLTFVCLCQYFVIWFESTFRKNMPFSVRLFFSLAQILTFFKMDDDIFQLLPNLSGSLACPSLLDGFFLAHKSDLFG